jgi:molecular chaperone HtpG
MVAPVPFAKEFSFGETIYAHAKSDKIAIDEYSVFINENQLFKGYKDEIYKEYKKKEEVIRIDVFDKIFDIEFFKELFDDEILYWGWYGVTKNMQYIPTENNEKFIRLRKSNIQIGLEKRLDEFHKKESGNRYFIGEVYAVHKDLHPNARRDFFVENSTLTAFVLKLKTFFETLNELFYDFSEKNSAFKTIDKFGGKAVSPAEDESIAQKIVKAKETLAELYYRYKGRALAKIIAEKISPKELKKYETAAKVVQSKNLSPALAIKLGKTENDLLSFVFEVIRKAQAEKTAEKLIAKIQEEVKNKYLTGK